MKLYEVIDRIEEWAPLCLQESWDNSGLQVGDIEADVTGIVVALDCEPEVVEYAAEKGYNVIINHHPLIFKPLSNIDYGTALSRIVASAIKNDIAVYAAHTNLDIVKGGVNDALAEAIGYYLPNPIEDKGEGIGMGRYGEVERISNWHLAQEIKGRLGMQNLVFYGWPEDEVGVIAVAGGCGSYLIDNAVELGIDTLITGDIKYHESRHAYYRGLSLIDLGHYASEYPVVWKIKDYLEEVTDGTIPIEVYDITDNRAII